MVGKHAVEAETGPMPVSEFTARFCEHCRPVFQAFADTLVRQARESPCPIVYYYKKDGGEYCALRIGTHNSTWEVRVKVTEEMHAGPNEPGAWVHWGYQDDPGMAAIMATADDLATRL
jgi:hypothetical protein